MQNLKKNWLMVWIITWGTWQIFTRAIESLKIEFFMGYFVQRRKCMYELKIYRRVMCYDNEEWCKSWKVIDLSIQNWHEKFNKFWPAHSKISKIHTLMGCLWNNSSAYKVKRSSLGGHSRLIKNFKENWLVFSKMMWRIWQIFFHRLENSDFILES